jgi:Ca2+-transporting ATPase
MPTLAELLQLFPSAPELGLAPEQVELSRRQFGTNRLTPLRRDPAWKELLAKFDEPIITILLAAALLSILVELFAPPWDGWRYLLGALVVGPMAGALAAAAFQGRRHWIPALLFLAAVALWILGIAIAHASLDGLAVLIAVLLATGVAFVSEYSSHREFEFLNARKEPAMVKALRAGTMRNLPSDDVVAGDVIALEMGDEVPADGAIFRAASLAVDQSLMTGEAEPVSKSAYAPGAAEGKEATEEGGSIIYRGTQITEGAGLMLATAVGDQTYLGQIAQRLGGGGDDVRGVQQKLGTSKELTPLQQKLQQLAGTISKVGYAAAGLIFVAQVLQGVYTGELSWPGAGDEAVAILLADSGALLRYFLYMVVIIVVAVPEGLPMSVTVSLALAMRKMTRANSLVRQLMACETIGSATVICTDKTGTLTQNRMRVERLAWDGQVLDRGTVPATSGRPVAPPAGRVSLCAETPFEWMVLNAAVNSTAHLEQRDGKLLPIGNSTEAALLQWLQDLGLDYRQVRLQQGVVAQLHFSSERKRMTTVLRAADHLLVLVKGAPDWLLEHATQYLTVDGQARRWTETRRTLVQEQLQDSAERAFRTLAFAHAIIPTPSLLDDKSLPSALDSAERDLIFGGFVAIADPLRDDVRLALDQCRSAGIGVKMVTGDHVATARAIGRQIGLLDDPEALLLTSEAFNELSDAQLSARLPQLRILARARPLDKLRLVRLLQAQGAVVAVTGDGTNDAPALKKADVGLAMGCTGTAVAKEASKIVLLDDAFSTIVRAVHWGRALSENIQRFLQFQLTINISALVIALLGPLAGVRPPFTILQLLWINVIMDTLASIALCSEPPRPGLMRRPPRPRDESILTPTMRWTIASTASFFILAMMALLLLFKRGWWAGDRGTSTEFSSFTVRQVSIFFSVYVFFQVWNEINCRSLEPHISGLRGLWRNPVFLGVAGLIVAGQVLIVTFGGATFHVEPLAWTDWLAIAAVTSSVLVFAELTRRFRLHLAKGGTTHA